MKMFSESSSLLFIFQFDLNPFYNTKYLKQIFSFIIRPFDLRVTIKVLKNG